MKITTGNTYHEFQVGASWDWLCDQRELNVYIGWAYVSFIFRKPKKVKK